MTDINSTLAGRAPFNTLCNFTLWGLQENRAGAQHAPIKVPLHWDAVTKHSLGRPARGNRPAVTPNPAPPMTAQLAWDWLQAHLANPTAGFHTQPGKVGYLGIGFRPEGTGLVCIDLDDCVQDGAWNPGAAALFARFPGALIESSVSGRGAHIWCTVTGDGPGRRGKQVTPLGEIEVYGSGQFIACGTVICGDASVDHTAAVASLIAEFWPEKKTDKTAGVDFESLSETEQAQVVAEIRSTFPMLDQAAHDDWVARGMALTTLGDEIGLPLWHELSALHPKYDPDETEDKWFGLYANRTSYQALFTHAESRGWVNPRRRQDVTQSDASAVFEVLPALSPLPAGAVLEPPPSRQLAAMNPGLSFMAAAAGSIPSTVATVTTALGGSESVYKLRYDIFKDDHYISENDQPWRPVTAVDEINMRIQFEQRGFKPVSADNMSDAIKSICDKNKVDSALEWIQNLPAWDGVPRMAGMLSRYYGAEDTPYTQAVGRYLMSALAGRTLKPGVKADMMPILIGGQGGGKTSSVEALCPDPANFGELDMTKNDADLARALRGKQIMELAELQGLSGRALESTKAWISRKEEKWIPKFEEREAMYPRRIIVIGTTNETEILDDPTGERRFLPVKVGVVDVEGLVRDRDQLWAEGAAKFMESGIAWQDAMALAPAVHAEHKVHDDWYEPIVSWLDSVPPPTPGHPIETLTRGSHPLALADILTGALNMARDRIDMKASKRASKIMKLLKFRTTVAWVDGKAVRRWVRC